MVFKPIKTKEDLDRFVLEKLITPAKPPIMGNLKSQIAKPQVVK
jgi:hypothetical protein